MRAWQATVHLSGSHIQSSCSKEEEFLPILCRGATDRACKHAQKLRGTGAPAKPKRDLKEPSAKNGTELQSVPLPRISPRYSPHEILACLPCQLNKTPLQEKDSQQYGVGKKEKSQGQLVHISKYTHFSVQPFNSRKEKETITRGGNALKQDMVGKQ